MASSPGSSRVTIWRQERREEKTLFSWFAANKLEKREKTLGTRLRNNCLILSFYSILIVADGLQARNQDFMWGGANEAKVDETTEMYFLMSDPFI